MNFIDFIAKKIAKNELTFTLDEAKTACGQSTSDIKKEIEFHKEKKHVFPLLEDFCVIVPENERKRVRARTYNYIEDLGQFLDKNGNYYVSMLRASDLHGASHHAIFVDFLTIDELNYPFSKFYKKEELRDNIKYLCELEGNIIPLYKGYYRTDIMVNQYFPPEREVPIPPKTKPPEATHRTYELQFPFPKKEFEPYPEYKTNRKNIWRKEYIEEKKGFYFSSPSLTAVDLIYEHAHWGSMSDVLHNIQELSEAMTADDICELLSWYPNNEVLQRFGFLLELLSGEKTLIEPLENHFKGVIFEKIRLSDIPPYDDDDIRFIDAERNEQIKELAKKWNIEITFVLDNDLDFPDYTLDNLVEFHAH
ncbi:MAG: hypothetical protein OXC03_07350 [Flavobacteriaceae bacterium]|nr:hypothetical protein [Flavobacteriaceae bacterium]